MPEKCRATKKDGNRCTSNAKEGCAGFCGRHFPKQKPEPTKSKWEWVTTVGGILTIITAAEQIIQHVIQNLPPNLLPPGPEDVESQRYHDTEREIARLPEDQQQYARDLAIYRKQLVEADTVVRDCKQLLQSADDRGEHATDEVAKVERDFHKWYANLNKFTQMKLTEAIESQHDKERP
jgi:hypothetical protein